MSTLCPGTTGTGFFVRAGVKTPFFAMKPERVAAAAALRKERDVIIPGALNKVLRIVPAGVKLNAVAKMKKKQAKSAGQRGM